MHLFLKLIFGIKFYMFRRVPSSIIRSFSLYTQQWYMSYRFADCLRAGSGRICSSVLILLASCQQTFITCTIAVCRVKAPWWGTEELPETCSFIPNIIWEISVSSWFYSKNSFLRLYQPHIINLSCNVIARLHCTLTLRTWKCSVKQHVKICIRV